MNPHTAFSYRMSRDGRLMISWQGRPVLTCRGQKALALHARLLAANEKEQQMILAKSTGNFKRGNERLAKDKYK